MVQSEEKALENDQLLCPKNFLTWLGKEFIKVRVCLRN